MSPEILLPWPCPSLGVGSGISKLRNHQNNFSQGAAPGKILLDPTLAQDMHDLHTENTLLKMTIQIF